MTEKLKENLFEFFLGILITVEENSEKHPADESSVAAVFNMAGVATPLLLGNPEPAKNVLSFIKENKGSFVQSFEKILADDSAEILTSAKMDANAKETISKEIEKQKNKFNTFIEFLSTYEL